LSWDHWLLLLLLGHRWVLDKSHWLLLLLLGHRWVLDKSHWLLLLHGNLTWHHYRLLVIDYRLLWLITWLRLVHLVTGMGGVRNVNMGRDLTLQDSFLPAPGRKFETF
jgi:hypothetical protein